MIRHNKFILFILMLITSHISFAELNMGEFFEKFQEIVNEQQQKQLEQQKNSPPPNQSNNYATPQQSSTNTNTDSTELIETKSSIEEIGESDERLACDGVGETNKRCNYNMAILDAVRVVHGTSTFRNTEFANKMINNEYRLINQVTILKEENTAPTLMGQQKDMSQARWDFRLKVNMQKNIPEDLAKIIEKDRRILYYDVYYETDIPELEVYNALLGNALIQYHGLDDGSSRQLIANSVFVNNALKKEYGLYEDYDFNKVLVKGEKKDFYRYQAKITLANVDHLKNAEQIKKDIDISTQLSSEHQKLSALSELNKNAQNYYYQALGKYGLQIAETQAAKRTLHLGSQLGDSKTETLNYIDLQSRKDLVNLIKSGKRLDLELAKKGQAEDLKAEQLRKEIYMEVMNKISNSDNPLGSAFGFLMDRKRFDKFTSTMTRYDVNQAIERYKKGDIKIDTKGNQEVQQEESIDDFYEDL